MTLQHVSDVHVRSTPAISRETSCPSPIAECFGRDERGCCPRRAFCLPAGYFIFHFCFIYRPPLDFYRKTHTLTLMKRTCRITGQEFEVSEEDIAFLKKIGELNDRQSKSLFRRLHHSCASKVVWFFEMNEICLPENVM